MLLLIILILLAICVFGLIAYLGHKKNLNDDMEGNPLDPDQIRKRRERLQKILELAKLRSKISLLDIQGLLKVNSEMALRHVTYLVDLGKLVIVNDRGQEIYYKLPR